MAWAPAYVLFNAAGGMSTPETPSAGVADVLGDALVVGDIEVLTEFGLDVLVTGAVPSSLHPASATSDPATTIPIRLLRNNNDPFPSGDAAPTGALD